VGLAEVEHRFPAEGRAGVLDEAPDRVVGGARADVLLVPAPVEVGEGEVRAGATAGDAVGQCIEHFGLLRVDDIGKVAEDAHLAIGGRLDDGSLLLGVHPRAVFEEVLDRRVVPLAACDPLAEDGRLLPEDHPPVLGQVVVDPTDLAEAVQVFLASVAVFHERLRGNVRQQSDAYPDVESRGRGLFERSSEQPASRIEVRRPDQDHDGQVVPPSEREAVGSAALVGQYVTVHPQEVLAPGRLGRVRTCRTSPRSSASSTTARSPSARRLLSAPAAWR